MKQGFLVYFDNCRQTQDLADQHYATLWRTVFAYAEKLAQGDGDAERYLNERIKTAPGGVDMALRFITDNVRRDHRRYQSRREHYRSAQEQQRGGKNTQPWDCTTNEEVWKYINSGKG